MALTVGTDAYDTLANVDTYWVERGNAAWAAATEAEREIAIRKASDFLDRRYRWRGQRATASQRLEWPRLYAYDDDGFEFTAGLVPRQVREATAIVADLFRAAVVDLDGIVTNDAAVQMQKVDVITVQYDTRLRLQGPVILTHVNELLRQVRLAGGALMRA